MIKKLTLLSCLFASCLFANENQNINRVDRIGRYQLTANEKEIYLLETDTGKIWGAQKIYGPGLSKAYPNWVRLQLDLPQDRTQ